jgi:hypothetical protein
MSGGSHPRWDDPRDRDDKSHDIEVKWIELERGPPAEARVPASPPSVRARTTPSAIFRTSSRTAWRAMRLAPCLRLTWSPMTCRPIFGCSCIVTPSCSEPSTSGRFASSSLYGSKGGGALPVRRPRRIRFARGLDSAGVRVVLR